MNIGGASTLNEQLWVSIVGFPSRRLGTETFTPLRSALALERAAPCRLAWSIPTWTRSMRPRSSSGGKFEEISTSGLVGVPNADCSLHASRLSIASGSTRKRRSTITTRTATGLLHRPLVALEPLKFLLLTSRVGGGSGGTGLSASGVGTLAAR